MAIIKVTVPYQHNSNSAPAQVDFIGNFCLSTWDLYIMQVSVSFFFIHKYGKLYRFLNITLYRHNSNDFFIYEYQRVTTYRYFIIKNNLLFFTVQVHFQLA